MDTGQLVQALGQIPGVQVSAAGHEVVVVVPEIRDSVRLDARTVARVRRIRSPKGEPAVELAVTDRDVAWPLIVTVDDVVWAPADPGAVLDSRLPVHIRDAPDLVAYTEMERACLNTAVAIDGPRIDLARLDASLLLQRCFIAGALRFGLWPVRAAAWWRQTWEHTGGELGVGEFRTDPQWDRLMRDAVTVPLAQPPAAAPVAPATDAAQVSAADIARAAPVLTVARLDDEFVTLWRRWLPVTPGRFIDLLTGGLADATFEVALYADGAVNVDLRIAEAGQLRALLQLRFSIAERWATIDEVRITDSNRGAGLFQRLEFNTEQLATALGCTELRVKATGMGAYAFAVLHAYPRDPGLRAP